MSILHRKVTINVIRDQYRNKTSERIYFFNNHKNLHHRAHPLLLLHSNINMTIFTAYSQTLINVYFTYAYTAILYQNNNNNKYHVFFEHNKIPAKPTTKKIKKNISISVTCISIILLL